MNQIKEHLFALVKLFELIANMSRLDDEDRYWKLFRIKDKINWIRKELGYEPVKFVKGTNIEEKVRKGFPVPFYGEF